MEFVFLLLITVYQSYITEATGQEDHTVTSQIQGIYGSEWRSWKRRFNKNFSPEDEISRFNAWVWNWREVTEHNFRFSQGKEMYSRELNKFADRYPIILKHYLLPGVPVAHFTEGLRPVKFLSQDVPDEIDWVQAGWTSSPDKFLALHPIGWVSSTIKAVESQLYNMSGFHSSLSKQEILDCVRYNRGRPHITLDAFFYILRNGVTFEFCYPSELANRFRRNPCQRNKRHPSKRIKNYFLLEPGDEENLKIAVALVGPISVSIQVTESFFFYQSGVYYEPLCESEGEVTNHSVLLVGYGTDPTFGDFWVIQNNWGGLWGESGFARMTRNTLVNCGISAAAVYPVL